MSSIPPPKGGLKPPGSKIGLAKPGGLKAGLLAKGSASAKTGATPAPPSRQQSALDLTANTDDFKGEGMGDPSLDEHNNSSMSHSTKVPTNMSRFCVASPR